MSRRFEAVESRGRDEVTEAAVSAQLGKERRGKLVVAGSGIGTIGKCDGWMKVLRNIGW